MPANKQFFVGAQTVVNFLQTNQIIPDVCFITDRVAYASSNKTKIVWIETELFFFLSGADASHVYMGAWELSCFHSLNYEYPNLSEGADRVGGQLRGDKECPFSGVTKSGSLEEGAGKRCSECVLLTVRRRLSSLCRLMVVPREIQRSVP